MSKVKEVLVEARSIVEQGWNKYGNTDGQGNYCLRAAVGLASGALILRDDREVTFDRTLPTDSPEKMASRTAALRLDLDASDLIKQHLPEGYVSIPVFNDDPKTTKNDVVQILDKAISAC